MLKISKIKGSFSLDDKRFLEEMVKVISSIDGSSKMHIRTSDLPSRIKCVVKDPPELSLTDLKQINLMNSRIMNMFMDIKEKSFMVELWKNGVSKKRRRNDWDDYDKPLPKRYKDIFDNVLQEDKKVLENILKTLLGMDPFLCEFTVTIQKGESYYNMNIKSIEPVSWKFVEHINSIYRAFIHSIKFDFPNSTMKIEIRRNDAPIQHLK